MIRKAYRFRETSWIVSILSTLVLLAAGFVVLSSMAGCGLSWHQKGKRAIATIDQLTIAGHRAGSVYFQRKCKAEAIACKEAKADPCEAFAGCKKNYFLFTESCIGALSAAGTASAALDVARDAKTESEKRKIADRAMKHAAEVFTLLSSTYSQWIMKAVMQ